MYAVDNYGRELVKLPIDNGVSSFVGQNAAPIFKWLAMGQISLKNQKGRLGKLQRERLGNKLNSKYKIKMKHIRFEERDNDFHRRLSKNYQKYMKRMMKSEENRNLVEQFKYWRNRKRDAEVQHEDESIDYFGFKGQRKLYREYKEKYDEEKDEIEQVLKDLEFELLAKFDNSEYDRHAHHNNYDDYYNY